ncbi:AI-2E family transporter [Flavobacterium sp. RSSA_27]|uniref:AI-2E family transporter n=1 Tax=Flavobacterium sp. RSSA_27 TaxID=3447667 RepID=UPI003F3CE5D1
MEKQHLDTKENQFEKITDIIIRLGALAIILLWCFAILQPFILILIWAIVIAIAMYPVYKSFVKLMKGKKKLPVFLLTLVLLSLIIIPSTLVTESLYEGVSFLTQTYQEGKPLIPPPGETTANWPSFAKPVIDIWQHASENLQETVLQYSDQVTAVGSWLVAALAGVGKGILQFNLSIIIAGFILAYSEDLKIVFKKISQKLAGAHGAHFANLTVQTIQNVVKGFLGVAIIQAVMAGLGFFIAGVPFAGLWSVACLILAIVQIGVGPIVIPIAIYMFSVSDTTTAILLSIWFVIIMISDNILKPILLGKNAPVPMPVVFVGSIGGFIYSGFLGLFLGAVVLTIGYKLFLTWIETEN